jgi:hypothetical protein
MSTKTLELKHTIKFIDELSAEIDEIEAEIKKLVDETGTIPELSYNTVAVILAEIGDFSNFAMPDKVLAFAGMSRLHINRDSLPTAMLTWKSEVQNTCDMPYTMLPNTFINGTKSLQITMSRNLPD